MGVPERRRPNRTFCALCYKLNVMAKKDNAPATSVVTVAPVVVEGQDLFGVLVDGEIVFSTPNHIVANDTAVAKAEELGVEVPELL